jgi:hypothetical protein
MRAVLRPWQTPTTLTARCIHVHGVVGAGVVFDLKHLGSLYPTVQSLDWDYTHNKLLVGTMANEVYEVADTDGADLNGGALVQSHFRCAEGVVSLGVIGASVYACECLGSKTGVAVVVAAPWVASPSPLWCRIGPSVICAGSLLLFVICCSGELHGLSHHPIRDEICTVGDDATLRVYDLITHRLLRMTRLPAASRCCAYSPDGTKIAVGLGAPEPEKPYNHWEAAHSLSGEVSRKGAPVQYLCPSFPLFRWGADVRVAETGCLRGCVCAVWTSALWCCTAPWRCRAIILYGTGRSGCWSKHRWRLVPCNL